MNSKGVVAPTVEARLACACNCAYGISVADGSYTAPKIYDAGVGWIGGPVPISAAEGDDPSGKRINACLVGLNQDGIIVAMRGTLPPAWTLASLEDWWQDIVDSKPVAAPALPGKVHEGFYDALCTIWEGMLGAVNALKQANPDVAIYVTGHSKGGPLASIGAARLLLAEQIAIKGVVTFASPHPGNADFVGGYPASIPVKRFENYLDIVPFLPPTATFFKVVNSLLPASWKLSICRELPKLCHAIENAVAWNYTALGTLLYVDKGGKVLTEGDPSAKPEWRLMAILLTLLGLEADKGLEDAVQQQLEVQVADSGLSLIGAAHCIGCKCEQPDDLCAGGYMTGAGSDVVCNRLSMAE